MTPLVSCRGIIWSNQTRLRLGCWCRTLARICCQAEGSKTASAARREVPAALAAEPASRGDGEWVVSMMSFQRLTELRQTDSEINFTRLTFGGRRVTFTHT